MNRQFDGTGWTVRAIGLGGMPMSIAGRPDEARSFEVIERFVSLGGNFIDTANVYCQDDSDIGHNERLIHRGLVGIGAEEQVIVATKGGMRRPGGDWVVDARPEWLRSSCEKSLKDLGTDAIALYQLHAVDTRVPFAESLAELIRLKDEGKIRHIGLSNVDAAQLGLALDRVAIASVQNRCNPFCKRDFTNGVIELCRSRGVAYLPYSPVGGHSGHVRLPDTPLFRRLSEKYGVSAYRVALAWLLQAGEHVIPIPGASKVSSVEDSAAATDLVLDQADIEAIHSLPDD